MKVTKRDGTKEDLIHPQVTQGRDVCSRRFNWCHDQVEINSQIQFMTVLHQQISKKH